VTTAPFSGPFCFQDQDDTMTSPTPDEAAAVRRRRAEGASIARIMAETGLGRRAVVAVLAAAEEGTGALSPPARNAKTRTATARKQAARPTKKAGGTKATQRKGTRKTAAAKIATKTTAASGDRGALVSRLWRTAEAQLREVARQLKEGAAEPAEREKDARTLAVLVKTLRELNALEAERAAETPREEESDVRDLDDFRRELAERIDRLRQARDADGASGGL
jgi:hypothetical protein